MFRLGIKYSQIAVVVTGCTLFMYMMPRIALGCLNLRSTVLLVPVFRRFRKIPKTYPISFVTSVLPSVRMKNSSSTERVLMKFYIWGFFSKMH